MEVAITVAAIGGGIAAIILSIAHAYRLVIESNLKMKIMERELQQVPQSVTDDLHLRMENFRRERFSPGQRTSYASIPQKLRKEIKDSNKEK